MRLKNILQSLSSASPRRSIRWPQATRLCLETIEDRCLLSFSPAITYLAGTGPQAVATADFNGDGRLDLAVANYYSHDVSVLRGNGNGTFQSPLNSATGGNPSSIAVGDFNADGKVDVATANAGGVSVLLGNGNGTFRTPTSIDIGYTNVRSVAVGDFNADGKLDLAVSVDREYPGYYGGGYSAGGTNVLLGNGAGVFTAVGPTSLVGGYLTDLVAEDFNGDGRDDLAVANADSGVVEVQLANPDGSLSPLSSNWSGQSFFLTVAGGDFNRDGKFDLVKAGSGGVGIGLGNGDGTFRWANTSASYSSPIPLHAAVADFNGDGKLDLVTSNYYNSVSVLLGTGTGDFTQPLNFAVGSGTGGVATGDFNGDGRTDAASARDWSDANHVAVLLNDGSWPAPDSPSITISDVSVTEGNTGTTIVTFTVNLSAATSRTVTIGYHTTGSSGIAGGSATAGSDYQAKNGTLTFAPGETSKTVTVLVVGDRFAETNESFVLALTDPVNAILADASGLGVILDDEPHVSIDRGPVSVTEGNAGSTTMLFTVRLATASSTPVSVNYSTFEGDTDFPFWGGYGYYEGPPAATAGSDFRSSSGTVTFAPGETSKTIAVIVYGDLLGESDEYLSVDLASSSGGSLDSVHAVGIIVDDEPIVSIGGASVTEGNSGTKAMTFTVTLSRSSTAPVTVTYATGAGSATAGSDYQAKTGTLTFAPGETSKTVTVLVIGDRLGESDESFTVALTSATNAGISPDANTGIGTIFDNEPRIRISSASVTEGNGGTKLMVFTVTLSVAYDQAVTVQYATQNSTAKAGEDYVATTGTLTFAPGQTSKTFTVTIKGDTKKENDEYFSIFLSNSSSNAFIDNADGYGTILNDDGRLR